MRIQLCEIFMRTKEKSRGGIGRKCGGRERREEKETGVGCLRQKRGQIEAREDSRTARVKQRSLGIWVFCDRDFLNIHNVRQTTEKKYVTDMKAVWRWRGGEQRFVNAPPSPQHIQSTKGRSGGEGRGWWEGGCREDSGDKVGGWWPGTLCTWDCWLKLPILLPTRAPLQRQILISDSPTDFNKRLLPSRARHHGNWETVGDAYLPTCG